MEIVDSGAYHAVTLDDARVMDSIPDTNSTYASPIRLFVVDDDDGIRMLLDVTVSLDPRFTTVGFAASGQEALEKLTQAPSDERPELILLDVTLRDANAIELLPSIRAVAPAGVKIALYTGWNDQNTILRARASGADAVIVKDGNTKLLLDQLAELAAAVVEHDR